MSTLSNTTMSDAAMSSRPAHRSDAHEPEPELLGAASAISPGPIADAPPTIDYEEHRNTYDLFLRIALYGSLHVATVLVCIVIATMGGSGLVAAAGMLLATIAAIYGLVKPDLGDMRPSMAVLVLALVAMAVSVG